jgi:tryptophan synthase alpha subunit
VADVQKYADAVVVGSAIVQELERVNGEGNIAKRIGEFSGNLLPAKSSRA